jgi:hypothetical protein
MMSWLMLWVDARHWQCQGLLCCWQLHKIMFKKVQVALKNVMDIANIVLNSF